MKIVITGSNGQLGCDVIQELSSVDEVYVIPVTRQDCDLSDHESVSNFFSTMDFDALINCAAYTNVEEAETEVQQCFSVNAKLVSQLAGVCQTKRAKFLQISTDYIFDGTKKSAYLETDSAAPLNVYGASKLMGESLAQLYCENTMVLRVASLFGKRGASGKGGNFLTTIMKHAIEKGEISVVNDQWMSPTWTGDVAKMILALLDKNAPPGIYHAVNSGIASWYDLAKYACQLSDIQVDIKPVSSAEFPTVAIRPAYSVMDNAKISTIIGRIPRWQDAVKSFLHEYTLSERYC